MAFFKNLLNTIFGSASGEIKDREGLYFYVRCNKCGTPVRVRVNKYRDFQRDYDTGNLLLRKEVMDGGCFSLMYATIELDSSYKVIRQEIEGGEFITWDEYQQLAKGHDTESDSV
jgi:hypothetical protein